MADHPGEIFARHRPGRGEHHRLDPPHPFAPARSGRQVLEFAVEFARILPPSRHSSEPVEPERRASGQFTDRAEPAEPFEQSARSALGEAGDRGRGGEQILVEQRLQRGLGSFRAQFRRRLGQFLRPPPELGGEIAGVRGALGLAEQNAGRRVTVYRVLGRAPARGREQRRSEQRQRERPFQFLGEHGVR